MSEARELEGEAEAARVALDKGWAPVGLQVGQIGKVVSPQLGVGVALPGPMALLAGGPGSKAVADTNKDRGASIFRAVLLGIVADFEDVSRPLTAEFKRLRSSSAAVTLPAADDPQRRQTQWHLTGYPGNVD